MRRCPPPYLLLIFPPELGFLGEFSSEHRTGVDF
jgi:hypothetical protein